MTTLHTASYRAWRPWLGQPVVTSLQVPKWIDGAADWPQLWPACPRWSYFRSADFDRIYTAQLTRYGPKAIAGRLAEITRQAGRPDCLLLLCWEWEAERCHRSLFSTWWLHATGEPITEVQPEGDLT
jgi:hypothetical protein